MSTLSGSSTLAQVRAAYDDNASYAEDASVAKAKAFVTACRILLGRLPQQITQANRQGVQMDLKRIQEELERAQRYVSASASGNVVASSFENFRD